MQMIQAPIEFPPITSKLLGTSICPWVLPDNLFRPSFCAIIYIYLHVSNTININVEWVLKNYITASRNRML